MAARRLRYRFRDDPARLQQSLSRLAGAGERPAARVDREDDESAVRFAESVIASMDGPVLRYSSREALIEEALRRGLGRFEANLIIAAVQHRIQEKAGKTARPKSLSRGAALIGAICLAGLAQTLIVLAVWSFFRA